MVYFLGGSVSAVIDHRFWADTVNIRGRAGLGCREGIARLSGDCDLSEEIGSCLSGLTSDRNMRSWQRVRKGYNRNLYEASKPLGDVVLFVILRASSISFQDQQGQSQ